jgi:esterase
MKLHYRILGEGKPLIIIHGLFGFSDNWQTHAKKFASYFQVILVDMRNHGHSPWSDEFSYTLMVEDLEELRTSLGITEFILLGHSMGGKVAMHYAQNFSQHLERMIVVDIGIKSYPMHHQHILAGLHSLNLESLTARSQAESQLRTYIDAEGVIQFLLKNLYWKEKGKLAFRMNLQVLEREMSEILSALPDEECFVPTLFIRGELSNYILDEDLEGLETCFPDSTMITVPSAGHWVHAEAPDQFIDEVLSFCLR